MIVVEVARQQVDDTSTDLAEVTDRFLMDIRTPPLRSLATALCLPIYINCRG